MEKLALADEKVFLWINSLAGDFLLLDRVMQWLVSDYLIPVSMALTLVGLWFASSDFQTRQRYQIGMITALASMGISSLMVLISNAFFFRDRPFVDLDVTLLFYKPTDSSFPSNAAAAAFGIAFATLLVNRKLGTGMLIGASVYGFARVYAGVHYPVDIIAGAVIGFVISRFVLKLKALLGPIPDWFLKLARLFCLA